MASKQELQIQQVEKREEATVPSRVFLPTTDIYETQNALNVVMELPGVEKNNVDVAVEDSVLKVLRPNRFLQI
jgi:HSP20 family protein